MSDLINLAEYSEDDLQQIQKDIEKELRARDRNREKEARKEVKRVALQYGFNAEELFYGNNVHSMSGNVRKKAPIKYRHPEDPEHTWTGRGRTPRWIYDWCEAGGRMQDLQVDQPQEA